ncbi:hypothetical protein SUDANB1_05587 [Streptomyces sp. enrichment culture]|uniref:helix-turn-helix domain-containing protein n=1 Tax=Streptomyces sp. enrichment culture TaxID=1795815 RepID=UPI003F56561B
MSTTSGKRKYRPRLTGEARIKRRQDLRVKYEAGATIRVLADETGLSYGLTRDLLREARTVMRGRGARLPRPAAD